MVFGTFLTVFGEDEFVMVIEILLRMELLWDLHNALAFYRAPCVLEPIVCCHVAPDSACVALMDLNWTALTRRTILQFHQNMDNSAKFVRLGQ